MFHVLARQSFPEITARFYTAETGARGAAEGCAPLPLDRCRNAT